MKSIDTNRTDNGEGKPLCTGTCLRGYLLKRNKNVKTEIETFLN